MLMLEERFKAYWGVFCAFAEPLGEVMGAYLSQPVTEKESFQGENRTFKYGVTAMQGWRTEMEDAHAAVLDVDDTSGQPSGTGYFAVFDGHGGKEVAKFAAKYLASELVKTEAWKHGNLEGALADTYLRIDEILGLEDNHSELTELAGPKDDATGRQPMIIGEEELPEYMRDALIARIKAHNERRGVGEEADEDWGGDEFEDPDFDPLVDLDQEDEATARAKAADADVMTRDDSDAEDSEEATDDSGQEDMNDGSEEREEDAEQAADAESSSHALANGTSGAAQQQEYRGPTAGCTAVVALVRGNTLVVANAGDSRCVCSRAGTAVAMTTDHKPTDTEEYARITKAGGFITDGRVNGSLNLSRALGDMEYKRTKELPPAQQMITAMPEVRTLELQPGDEFLILACDGIWDVLTNQQAVDFVRERLQRGMELQAICEAMCDACLAPDTDGCGKGCDNMSAMVVVLKPFSGPAVAEGATPIPPEP